jgi:hypothetical protein
MDALEIYVKLEKMGFNIPIIKFLNLEKLYEFTNKIRQDTEQKYNDVFNNKDNMPEDITGFREIINMSIDNFKSKYNIIDDDNI